MYSKNLFNKKQKRNGVIAFGMISSAGKFTKISLSVVINYYSESSWYDSCCDHQNQGSP